MSKGTEKGTPMVAVDCMWIWADRPGWALECASLVWEDKPGQRGQPPSLEKATNLRLLPTEHGPSGSVTVSQGKTASAVRACYIPAQVRPAAGG